MRTVLLTALLAAAALAAGPAAAGEPEFSPVREELELARRAFRGGLYEFVAARMDKLLKERDKFPGRDRAVLFLAESDYLSGRREAAWKRLADLREKLKAKSEPGKTEQAHLNECEFWIGRAESEHHGKPGRAAIRLRRLLGELEGQVEIDQELLARTRYHLCRALVERGGVTDLDGEIKTRPDGKGGEEKIRVPGALELLRKHIKHTSVLLAEAHMLRARALYLRGRPRLCFEKLRDEFLKAGAFASSPLRGEALFWQAEALYGQSKWTGAAALFAAAAAAAQRFGKNPAKDRALIARAHYNRGWALYKRAEDLRRARLTGGKELLSEALKSFKKVMDSGGKELAAAARLRSGAALHFLGRERDQEEALEQLKPLWAEEQHGAEALYFSARALASLGRYAQAGGLLDQAARKAKDGSVLAARIDMARGENRFARAGLVAKKADAAKLLAAAAELFGRVQCSPAPGAGRYAAQRWIARIRARQAKLAEAEKIAGDLLDTVPAVEALREDRIAYWRGRFLLEMAKKGRLRTKVVCKGREREGDTRSLAIEFFSQARRAGPRGEFAVPATLGAAKARLMLKETPDAHSLFDEVLKHPGARPGERHRAHLGIARTLRASRRYRKAAKYVQEKLLDAEPPPAADLLREALELRADCLAAADDSESAAQAYARLASGAADPAAAARARISRAAQLGKLGRHAQAAGELAGLLKSCPAEVRAEVEFLAAGAYQRAGQPQRALELYTAAGRRPGQHQREARVNAAQLELDSGNPRRAAAQARDALDLVKAGSMLAARAAWIRAQALMRTGDPAGAAGQFRQAADAARGQRAVKAGRALELAARRGLGEALGRFGRHQDAAASYLQAAYLADPAKPDPELLELAAKALDAAGEKKAAAEVRRLAGRRVQD